MIFPRQNLDAQHLDEFQSTKGGSGRALVVNMSRSTQLHYIGPPITTRMGDCQLAECNQPRYVT